MMKRMLSVFFKIFCIILLYAQSVSTKSKIQKCDDSITETEFGIAYWKYKGVRYTTSEDVLCWKENGKLFVRECNTDTGEWMPASVDCAIQKFRNRYCPEDLLEVPMDEKNPLCIQISQKPQPFDESFCYGSDTIALEESINLMAYLSKRNIREYWLPIRRENATMPFTIRLPGKQWQQVVDENMFLEDFISNRNCLSLRYTNSSRSNKRKRQKSDNEFILEMSHCERPMHMVCLYKEPILDNQVCPEGFGALSYRPNECYGINLKDKSPSTKYSNVPIDEYYEKRNSIAFILSKSIPKDEKEKFFEIDSFVDQSKDKYLVLMNKKQRVEVAVDSQRHPILSKTSIPMNEVKMILKIDGDHEDLMLVIYNLNYIWHLEDDKEFGIKCFTNADYELLRPTKIDLVWKNDDIAKTIFKVKLIGDGPGEYWCEAHTVFNFQMVTSPRVVATKDNRGHAFAARMQVSCIDNGKNLCTDIDKNAKRIAKNLRQHLRKLIREDLSDLIVHNVRLMNIEQILNSTIISWVHVTASLKNSAIDNSEEESSEEDNSSEDDNRVRHDTSVRMKVLKLLEKLIFEHSGSMAIVRSTEYCFPTAVDDESKNLWMQAVRGQSATTQQLCLQESGLPFTRLCQGDFIHGASWAPIKDIECQQESTKITQSLYSLETSKLVKVSPEKIVQKARTIIEENKKDLVAADIHFTSNIMQASVKSLMDLNFIPKNAIPEELLKKTAIWKNATRDFMAIYNYLIDVKEDIIKMSAKLNSTNKLLEAFENAMDTFSSMPAVNETLTDDDSDEKINPFFEVYDYDDIGVSVKVSQNLLYFRIDPSVANISGVALFRNINASVDSQILTGAFKNEYYQFLQADHTLEDFINEPNLQLGTYVPSNLLNRLNIFHAATNNTYASPNPIVVIKIYSNDKLFKELDGNSQMVPGRIVSISIPGNTDLPEDLPLVLRRFSNTPLNDSAEFCNYWNYKGWASDGITISGSNEDVVICQLTHLTPFAYLVGYNFTVDDNIEVNIKEIHEQALDIITVTGCSLSLMGICGIFITAAAFHNWRQKASSKVLLQLSAAIALQMIILCFVNTEKLSLHLIINEIVPSCVAIGAFLHYSVLVQFFWMMLIAYLQFKRYVQVFGQSRPKRFLLKSAAICWGLPLIPVLLVVILDRDSFSKGGICYPSGYALYFGIILPITAIIIANFVIFCLIIYNILRGPATPIRHTEKPILISQIRLSILLFFLLGFTWCFGLLSAMRAGIVFSYLFCLTATLQGFVIFIYFIILDPVTRRMWGDVFVRIFGNKKTHNESMDSFKDTTQTY
ncbi:uncharacterized protein LOC6651029 [Drosophila willistoni]|nr:uncharacterized protein LOC6651029 [Drosophila willistoni]